MTKKKSFYDTLYYEACGSGQEKLDKMKTRGVTLEHAWKIVEMGASSLTHEQTNYVIRKIWAYTNGVLPKPKDQSERVFLNFEVKDYKNPFVGNKLKTEIEKMPPRKNKTEELSVKEKLKKYMEKPRLEEIHGQEIYVATTISYIDDDQITLSFGDSGLEIEISVEELYEIIK